MLETGSHFVSETTQCLVFQLLLGRIDVFAVYFYRAVVFFIIIAIVVELTLESVSASASHPSRRLDWMAW